MTLPWFRGQGLSRGPGGAGVSDDGWFRPDGLWARTGVIVLYIYTELIVALTIVVGINRWKGRRKKARDASGHPGNP